MDQQKKFYVVLAMFAVLALVAWMVMKDVPFRIDVPVSMDRGHLVFMPATVSLRQVTLAVLALFALRSWLHWHAEKIRMEREQSEADLSS